MAVTLPDGVLAAWAVAAGTLLLATVTYYQARLLVRERKANQGILEEMEAEKSKQGEALPEKAKKD
jgi:hypothetical protein